MVVKMSSPGRSFGGVADYCLHDPRMPGEAHHPESAERVEWTETRNLATSEGERAGRIMAATAEASPELKRLAGVAATGRKLEKPVCHYSLSWAKDEKPDRQEMRWAAQESLKALGMERHQALVVSHRDGQPHVHVIANRVDPESGQAAGLNRSKLKLSKWAEEYERGQGKIRCPAAGEEQCEAGARETGSGSSLAPDRAAPAGGDEPAAAGAASEDPGGPGRVGAGRTGSGWPGSGQRSAGSGSSFRGGVARRSGNWRNGASGSGRRFTGVTSSSGNSWRKIAEGRWGASGLWRELGGKVREIGGAIRGDKEVLGRFRAELEDRLRWQRVSLGKEHSEAVRGIESKAGEFYREGLEGSEKRAREAARTDGISVRYGWRRGTNLTHSSTRCWRSGWSRCGRSTESWLTGR